jgi:hypothetical protein
MHELYLLTVVNAEPGGVGLVVKGARKARIAKRLLQK